MGWIQRHVVAVAAVAIALSATAGVFLFARPAYHPRVTEVVVDMTNEDHYTVPEIKHAFAGQGLSLHRLGSQDAIVNFSTAQTGPTDFLVTLFAPTRKVMFSAPNVGVHPPVERRLGNVLITYGGHDKRLAARIEAAADALAH